MAKMTKILIVMDLRCVLWNVADTCYSLSSDAKSWILKKLPITIVFKPGPVQGPRSGFRPGHRVNLYFKKNSKRRRFSKKTKTKVNGLQPGFAGSTRRVGRVTSGHGLSYFLINPARFQPRVGPVPGQPVRPGRVSKLCW